MEYFLFFLFKCLICFSSIMILLSRNPIHSILYFILVFFNGSGLLLLLGAEFLALVYVVVYVGAIAVLFLFIVMMLNVKIIEETETQIKYLPVSLLLGFFFSYEFLGYMIDITNFIKIYSIFDVVSSKVDVTNIEQIGILVFTVYYNVFLICSLILLLAMVGSIILTLYHNRDIKRQFIYKQVLIDFKETLKYKV